MSDENSDDDDRGEYDLASPAAPPRPLPVMPVVVDLASTPEVIVETPLAPTALAYRAPKEEFRGANDPETIKNLYMPLWLLGGGVAIQMVAVFLKSKNIQLGLAEIGVDLVFGTVFMLAGILLAAKARQIDLGGNFWVTCLKLSAVAVAPTALATLLSPVLDRIPIAGGLAGAIVMFCFYFALLGALFDLDQSDTWFCICVIFLVRLAVYFVMLKIAG